MVKLYSIKAKAYDDARVFFDTLARVVISRFNLGAANTLQWMSESGDSERMYLISDRRTLPLPTQQKIVAFVDGAITACTILDQIS